MRFCDVWGNDVRWSHIWGHVDGKCWSHHTLRFLRGYVDINIKAVILNNSWIRKRNLRRSFFTILGAFTKLRKATISFVMSLRLSVRLSPSVRLSVRLSVSPPVCPSPRPSVRPSLLPSGCLTFRPAVCPSVYPFVCPSVWSNSALTGRSFLKCDIWVFFENLLRKLKFH